MSPNAPLVELKLAEPDAYREERASAATAVAFIAAASLFLWAIIITGTQNLL